MTPEERTKLEYMAKHQHNARAKQLLAEEDAKKPQAQPEPEAEIEQEDVNPSPEENTEESHEIDS